MFKTRAMTSSQARLLLFHVHTERVLATVLSLIRKRNVSGLDVASQPGINRHAHWIADDEGEKGRLAKKLPVLTKELFMLCGHGHGIHTTTATTATTTTTAAAAATMRSAGNLFCVL